MNRTEKAQEVETLSAAIGGSANAFLIDFTGLDVERSKELRRELRGCDARLRIVKNRLATRAFADSGLADLEDSFVGQTAIAYPAGDDVVAVAKVLRDFAKEHEVAPVKAGLVEGQVIDISEFDALADLPSREALVAKALYLMMYPITGLATALNGVLSGFVIVLEQIRQQKESD